MNGNDHRESRVERSVASQPAEMCVLCAAQGVVMQAGVRDRVFSAPGKWRLRRCPRCGLVWLDPRPSEGDLAKLYENYYTHAPGEAMPARGELLYRSIERQIHAVRFGYADGRRTGWRALVGRMLSCVGPLAEKVGGGVAWLHARDRGYLLEVGSGNGSFLRRMRDLGWRTVGVEPDQAACEASRTVFGLDVHCGTLEAASFASNQFDVISMSHVLEHLPDPARTLRECCRILKPGGRLVLATPNVGSLGRKVFGRNWIHWDPPRHLFLFDARTLSMCVTAAGFQVARLRTSARFATASWNTAATLRRLGRIPDGSLQHVNRKLGPAAIGFWLLEYVLTLIGMTGEELILVANKPQTTTGSPRAGESQVGGVAGSR